MGLLPESEAVQQCDRAHVARVGGREHAVFLQLHEQVVQDGSNCFGGMAAVLRVRREREPECWWRSLHTSGKERPDSPSRVQDFDVAAATRWSIGNDREFDSVIRMGFDAVHGT